MLILETRHADFNLRLSLWKSFQVNRYGKASLTALGGGAKPRFESARKAAAKRI